MECTWRSVLITLNRPDMKLLLLTIAAFVAMTIAAPNALADPEMKRSAGSMERSTGTDRKGNTLGSRTSGRSSIRTSRRSAPELPSEQRRKDKDDDDDKGKSKARYRSDDDDEDSEPDFGSRSLGKVCMYGARGEVIFRPRGAQCKGDAPAELDQFPELGRDSERPRAATSRSTAAAPDRFGPPPNSRARPVSECVYGSEGQVLHTPAGGFCRPGGPAP